MTLSKDESTSGAPLLAVVMPVYNEEEALPHVIDEWIDALERLNVSYLLLLLDDGSTDSSLGLMRRAAAENSRVRVVAKENSGHGQTCICGYREAIAAKAEWIMQVDSDGQCDPCYLPMFWNSREFHLAVFGVRTTRADGFARTAMSTICRGMTQWALRTRIRDPNVPYRLIRSDVMSHVVSNFPDTIYLANIVVAAIVQSALCEHVTYVPIRFGERRGGQSSLHFLRMARLGVLLYRQLNAHRRFFQSSVADLRVWGQDVMGCRP